MKSTHWIIAVFGGMVVAGLFWLGSARPARADAIVNPCTDAGLGTALASGGLITFNCGGPATITVTTDARNITSTVVISGGNQITLAGSGISTFFWVRSPNGNLTLDGIRLTGAGSGGNTLFSDNILTVRNSAIYANASGLFFRTGSATLENTSFVSNTAGILADVNVTLRNVTILSNTPSSVYYARGGTTTISNTLFANANGNCNGTFASAGNNLATDGTCSLNQLTDLPNTKALLGTPVLGYASPLPGSLLIDGGRCAQTTDATGQARPGTGTAFCDIGAVEAQNVTVDLATEISISPTVAMLGRPVTYTIVISNAGTGRAASFALTETLAPAFVNVVSKTITSALASLAPSGAADSVLSWAGANLRQGARLTVTLTGNGAVTLTQSTLLTTTSSVYAPFDASGANDSAGAAFLASFAPDLNLVKTTGAAPVMPGERVTYTIVY
ncbi:MAG: choice-of-anchor Q domain-containing protein, partial [Thermoflexales bacterium]